MLYLHHTHSILLVHHICHQSAKNWHVLNTRAMKKVSPMAALALVAEIAIERHKMDRVGSTHFRVWLIRHRPHPDLPHHEDVGSESILGPVRHGVRLRLRYLSCPLPRWAGMQPSTHPRLGHLPTLTSDSEPNVMKRGSAASPGPSGAVTCLEQAGRRIQAPLAWMQWIPVE